LKLSKINGINEEGGREVAVAGSFFTIRLLNKGINQGIIKMKKKLT
jgi:hypothetical protein